MVKGDRDFLRLREGHEVVGGGLLHGDLGVEDFIDPIGRDGGAGIHDEDHGEAHEGA
ncbi:hypothetical protein SDC9_163957 [bioreactor metagenome]|uniref:Uncharacterized protein n=1 Tax=bioreactor metagenome TaxID=1076179 RepID=A0A645FSK8_9ZZZZ